MAPELTVVDWDCYGVSAIGIMLNIFGTGWVSLISQCNKIRIPLKNSNII
jgi:hypothetical protein